MLPEATLNDLWKFRGGINPMAEPKPVWKVDKDAEFADVMNASRSAGAVVAGFYLSLVENGMPQDDALAVTIAWMTSTFGKTNA